MMDNVLKDTLQYIADFYDRRKVGDTGPLGFRRSTDMMRLMACLVPLLEQKIIIPGKTRFLDLGCADARVNVFLSYLVKTSVGVELDEWTLEEHESLSGKLYPGLEERGLMLPPENIFLYNGDSTSPVIHEKIFTDTGLRLRDFDVFYTYLVMYQEFSRLILKEGKQGAIFMVYGLNRIMPALKGFRLLDSISPVQGILAVYQKI